MSNKYKGFLVTFDQEVSEEEMKILEELLYRIRNVKEVTPYIKRAEDHMSERTGYLKCFQDISEVIYSKINS